MGTNGADKTTNGFTDRTAPVRTDITSHVPKQWETFNPREAFGKAVVELGEAKDNCVVLAADLARTCNVLGFKDACPDNFFNVGICEQNMAGMSAGLAFEGKVPVVTSLAPFLTMRACEQIRTDVCYNNLHVIFVSIMSGISGAPLGSTHYGLEDMAIMRSFANMKVVQPSNALQVEKAMWEAYDTDGPVYIRLGSGLEPDVPSMPEGEIIGKAVKLKEGVEVSILATGYMVHKALEAADLLEQEGISAGVWDHPSIKPIDEEAVQDALLEPDSGSGPSDGGASSVSGTRSGSTGKVKLMVTLEEHNVYGGFGSAVAEVLSGLGMGVPLMRIGIPDIFIGVGNREDLLEYHQLD
jgi:transketolase